MGDTESLPSPSLRPTGARIMIAPSVQHELKLASRMSRLGTETAFEVLNKARALERLGRSIIHLEIGEPDFDTPENVVEAAVVALRNGWSAARCRARNARPAA